MMKAREAIVENYIEGYNSFDIEKMTRDMDESVQFKNVSDGKVNMELDGIDAFRQQAQEATAYFSERTQTINSVKHENGAVEIEVAYVAIAAGDLPNGWRKGQEIHLSGTSVFTFSKENRIISITDIS